MRSIRFVAVILAVLVGLASCSRDPEVVKKRYLESGNKYFEKGRYKEASIQYRNALKRSPLYGAAYYKLALVSLKQADVAGAVSALRRAKELIKPDQPEHWDAVTKLADLYLAYGKDPNTHKMVPELMKEVESLTKELLQRDANSHDAHRLIGDLNFTKAIEAYNERHPDEGLALLNKAVEEYRKADSIKPGQQGVLMQLARAVAAKGDYADAETLYRRVIDKDKTFQAAYTEVYRLLMFQRKLPEAEQVLKLAFANNPRQFGYLTLLAQHYGLIQRRDQMLDVLNQMKSYAKDWDQAYLTVGTFYLRMGDGDSAIREYKEGMAKDPKRKAVYQKSVIEVLMHQGKKSEAAAVNAEILKDNPKDNDARGLSATFLLDKGDIATALAELQAVVTASPQNPVAHYNLGRAHYMRGEAEQARQQFLKAIELKPDYIAPRLDLARLQVARGEYDGALKTAEQIVAIDKGNGNARLIQSAALMGQKKFSESRAKLEVMLKAYPGSPDVVFQLGVVNLAENKFKDAEDSFRRAYQLNPANPRGLLGLVETYMVQNKPDEALKILQAESDKAPNRVDLQVVLGNTAARTGKFDLAIQVFNHVLPQVDKGRAQGDIYLRLGEVYRRKGDFNNSVQALQKAQAVLPENVVVLSTLALVFEAALRHNEARQAYAATLKLDPNNAVALNNLAFLLAETGTAAEIDDALTKAQRAKQLMPNLLEISDTLGWIYLKKDLAGNAIDIFKDLVSKEPNISTYHYHLGMAYKQKGDKTRALDQLREALKYNPAKEEKDNIQRLIASLG
jgi:tetratricopeptide (TPR) repeat protein